MSERVDHAAEAQRVAQIAADSYGQIETRNGDVAVAQMIEVQTQAAVAQVHATLALVEQQRRIADCLEAIPRAHDESWVISVNGVSP